VSRLLVQRDGSVGGVVMEDGTEVHSDIVLSNCDPHTTFLKLVPTTDLTKFTSEEFQRNIKSYDFASATFKINLAVSRLPNFKCFPNKNFARDPENGKEYPLPGPQHFGTIHFLDNLEQLDEAFNDALSGNPSKRPFIEMTIPSSVDDSLVFAPARPKANHVVQLFVQYAPYKLADDPLTGKPRSWSDPGRREAFAKACYDVIEQYAPGFTESIIGEDLLSPLDLERIFGLTGGNIFHGSMGLDQLFWLRPAAGYSRYKTPFKNLYLCGSGAHPGGGVMGASGRNCAHVVLAEHK